MSISEIAHWNIHRSVSLPKTLVEPPAGDSGTEAVGFRSLHGAHGRPGVPENPGRSYVGLDSQPMDFRGGPVFVDTPGRVKQGLNGDGSSTSEFLAEAPINSNHQPSGDFGSAKILPPAWRTIGCHAALLVNVCEHGQSAILVVTGKRAVARAFAFPLTPYQSRIFLGSLKLTPHFSFILKGHGVRIQCWDDNRSHRKWPDTTCHHLKPTVKHNEPYKLVHPHKLVYRPHLPFSICHKPSTHRAT